MTNKTKTEKELTGKIRTLVIIFICGLILSGLTAFPIESQLTIAHQWLHSSHSGTALTEWIDLVYPGVRETNRKYPFISYGTDWLAFAHLILAVLFIGPLRDPVRNIWVIEFGIISCIAILPLALIAGEVREIPVFWRVIDCTFGIVGAMVMVPCYIYVKKLETIKLR